MTDDVLSSRAAGGEPAIAAGGLGPTAGSAASWPPYPMLRFFALLALLVAMFLFVPLAQSFNLEAGQAVAGKGDAARAADRAAVAQVEKLVASR